MANLSSRDGLPTLKDLQRIFWFLPLTQWEICKHLSHQVYNFLLTLFFEKFGFIIKRCGVVKNENVRQISNSLRTNVLRKEFTSVSHPQPKGQIAEQHEPLNSVRQTS